MAYDPNRWVADERAWMKRRRWLPPSLALLMLIMAATAVLEIMDGGSETRLVPMPAVSIAMLMFLVAMIGSPFARSGWIGPGVERMFDEFELASLYRAKGRAYAVLMLLVVALFLWLWLASINGWPAPRTPLDWSSLGLAAIAVGGVLPIFLAELMVPLPPADDHWEE